MKQENIERECKYRGSITLYDKSEDKWYFTDEKDATFPTLPASTFKIMHSLIALEENVVHDENEKFTWDGIPRTIGTPPKVMSKWNQDSDLKMAFQNSTVWVHEEIEKKLPRNIYQKYLSENNYGNGKLTRKGNFWVYGDFGVSPINQIEFLIKLENDKTTFSKRTTKIVKDFMCNKDNTGVQLCFKTGWTDDNDMNIGWYVGWLKKDSRTIFFSTRLKEKSVNDVSHFLECRKSVTNSYLRSLGIDLH